MKRFLWMAMAWALPYLGVAQEDGVKIQWVERIPMGDGTMVYRYAAGDRGHLEGECRLVMSEREYVIAEVKDGLPEGKWETYRYNTLYERRNYRRGRLDGRVLTYGSDGETVVAESTASAGKRNGRYASYYPDGTLEKEQEFKDGKEHGYLRTYDREGNVKWDCHYEEGKMHGRQTQLFFSNVGTYVRVSNYEHGVLAGDYSEVYEKGGLKEKGQYDEKGRKTGLWVRKDSRGGMIDETEYRNGERNGTRTVYGDDDVVEKVATYRDDELDGVTREFWHGRLAREYTYVDGRLDGVSRTYYEDGETLKLEEVYVSARLKGRKSYFPDGKLQRVEELRDYALKVVEEYDAAGRRIR
jgi:antitoxin component YwqK of YwqJK toxin-antitoxin module